MKKASKFITNIVYWMSLTETCLIGLLSLVSAFIGIGRLERMMAGVSSQNGLKLLCGS